jgi:short-subunit dehydrogenase
MKTALITGASYGIGAAFARELAARKTNLILVARSEDKLQQLATELEERHGIKAEAIAQDLTEPAAGTKLFESVAQKGLTVDLLVNNAGFGDYGTFGDRDLQRQLDMVQLNITVLVELTHLFLNQMRERRSGSIINVSSIGGFQPMPYMSVYAASKAFVLNFTEALRAENQNTGVTLQALCPGPTESNFFENAKFPQSVDATSSQNYASSEEVVRDSLDALDKNQSNVVTGSFINQVIVNLPRFLPREMLVNTIEKQFRNS